MGQSMTTQTLNNAERSAPGLLSGLDAFAKQHQDTLLLIGRILLGLIFLRSGSDKLMNIDGFAAGLAKNGVPRPSSPIWVRRSSSSAAPPSSSALPRATQRS